MCYFLPAEERKRQKIFSHTLPKGLGLRTGGKGQFFVLPCLPDLKFPPTHPGQLVIRL